MAYIVGHESSNGPYRININGGSTQLKQQPRTEAEAVSVSKVLLKDNKSFDMGLAQINSNNLVGLVFRLTIFSSLHQPAGEPDHP
jgi:type IV secretion system protein VirB1